MMKFKYFQIVLDDALDSAATGEGFIDPREATDAAFSGTLPSTLALSRDKARANLRWQQVVEALQESGAVDVLDIVETGGSEDTPPTAITFKVVYESDKLVQVYDLITDTSGATLFGPTGLGAGETEIQAIERAITNALAVPVTKPRFVFDPTLLGGKNTITKKFEEVAAATLATGASDSARRDDLETPFTLASAVVVAVGSGYSVADTLTVTGGTFSTVATLDVDEVIPVNAQDETNYDNVGANGTFAAGADYLANDVIILNDGTTVTVDAVTAGAITQFTVDNSTTTTGQSFDDTVLTQVSVTIGTPSGSGFTLTLDDNNQALFSVSVNVAGSYTVIATSPAAHSGGSGSGGTFTLTYSGLNVNVTQLDI